MTFLRGSNPAGAYTLEVAARIEESIAAEAIYPLREVGATDSALLVVNSLGGRLLRYRPTSVEPPRWGQPELIFDSGEDLSWTLFEDFSGDGIHDLLVMYDAGTRLDLFEGDGQGGLASPVTLGTSLPFGFFADTADIDGDGTLDAWWSGLSSPGPWVAFGVPGGGLLPPIAVSGPPSLAFAAALDIDLDGDQDLAFAINGRIELIVQTAPRTFAAPVVALPGAPTAGFVDRATSEDVDEDGDLDLLYVDEFGVLQFVESDGAGGFLGTAPLFLNAAWKSAPRFADIDLDGRRDFCAMFGPSKGSQRYAVWSKNLGAVAPGMPSFDAPRPVGGSAFGNGSRVYRPMDYDGDGDLDVGYATRPNVNTALPVPSMTRNERISLVGVPYCDPLIPNATGQPGLLAAIGSVDVAFNRLALRASQLPQNSFGFFLSSLTAGVFTDVPNSGGTLCLDGAIGRFVGPGEIKIVGADGGFTLDVDLTQIPTPNMGRVTVMAGQSWHFQAWHRESVGGVPTSNFTDAVRIDF